MIFEFEKENLPFNDADEEIAPEMKSAILKIEKAFDDFYLAAKETVELNKVIRKALKKY